MTIPGPYSAGSLCSTVSDILSWNHALHQGEVLSQDMYEVLITPLTLADGWPLDTQWESALYAYDRQSH